MPAPWCWAEREKNLFEILSSEESAGATRWDLPPLSGQESKRAPEKNGRLNTAAHLDEWVNSPGLQPPR